MKKTDQDQESLFRVAFDASPTPTFIVDHDVVIQDLNQAAASLLGGGGDPVLHKRGGEAMHCLHSSQSPEGCGRAPACQDCVVRETVGAAVAGRQTYRRPAAMELLVAGQRTLCTFLVTASPFHHQGRLLVLLAVEDVTELMALRSLVPICSNCKKVRTDQDYWIEVEKYMERYLGADFTHGICPDCARKLYPDLMQES